MRWLVLLVFSVVIVSVMSASSSSSIQSTSLEDLEDLEAVVASKESQEVHKRSKRTIGHIFDMFRKMMDGLFGGKKGGGGKGKGKGRGRPRRPGRPPGRPGAAYGAPQQQAPSGGYGAPQQQAPSGGYGAPQRPPPNLSGGYAGGQRPNVPPRGQRPPSNNYGGPPPQAPPNNYGGPQQGAPPPSNYGGPPQPNSPNIDSYGSPQAAPIGGGDIDSYGSPQAAPIGGNSDSYGAPQSNPIGPSNPISTYGRGQSSAPRTPSNSFGPGSAIKILPAPNLATEAPQGSNLPGRNQQQNSSPDSYGSPQANTISDAQNQDSYGSPQGEVISANPGVQDSYGSPQTGVLSGGGAPPPPPPPAVPQTNDFGSAQVTGGYQVSNEIAPSAGGGNPFLSTYGNNAAPLPVTNGGPFNTSPGNNFNSAPAQSTYGNGAIGGSSYVGGSGGGQISGGSASGAGPISDIDIPAGSGPIIIEGRNQNQEVYGGNDVFGSPVAPVGTSAPVPEDVILAGKVEPDSFDSYGSGAIDSDSERLADPNSVNDAPLSPAPEGEITGTEVGETGENTPLIFENLRDVAFTSADDTTESLAPLQIDLSGNVVDLTNGVDQTNNEDLSVDLTNLDSYGGDTTPVPTYYDDDDYFGDENTPPEFPEYIDDIREASTPPADISDDSLAGAQEAYGDAQETLSKYGDNQLDDEYYYEYAEDEYEYPDEYLEYEDDQASKAGAETTEPTAPEYSDAGAIEDGGNFISVPLMIEEVEDPAAAPVILAGTEKGSVSGADQQPQYGRGRTSKRRAPHAFHQFLQEPPQAKRQADWSQRIETRRRNRVWRQFNLD